MYLTCAHVKYTRVECDFHCTTFKWRLIKPDRGAFRHLHACMCTCMRACCVLCAPPGSALPHVCRKDNCPWVPNGNGTYPQAGVPSQADRYVDKQGDACDTSRCHPACATGCTKPNDSRTCTTPFFDGQAYTCNRCTAKYHAEVGMPGCVLGRVNLKGKCKEPSPSPSISPSPSASASASASASPGASPSPVFPVCIQTFEKPTTSYYDYISTPSVGKAWLPAKGSIVDYAHHPAMASSFEGAITVRTSGVNTGAIGSAATIGLSGTVTRWPHVPTSSHLRSSSFQRRFGTVDGQRLPEQRPSSVHAGCTITDVDHQVNTGPYGVWGC